MNPRNVANMPVMARKCHSCPFGPNGARDVRRNVENRLLTVSQTCHSTGTAKGKPDTHICRGARDWQLTIFFRMGFLPAPTDSAWKEKWEEMQKSKKDT